MPTPTTSTTSAEAIAQIAAVDRQLDAIMATVAMRCRGWPGDRHGWETAWRLNGGLHHRHAVLMRQRGRLQLERDAAINREYAAEQRRERAKMRRKPEPIGVKTPIVLRVGGTYVQQVALGQFLADNADGDLDFPAIKAALERGETYRGGGGAAPIFEIEAAAA